MPASVHPNLLQRLAGWLAPVAPIPPGAPGDGLLPASLPASLPAAAPPEGERPAPASWPPASWGSFAAPFASLGAADKSWPELQAEMNDARAAWRQNPLARRLVGMVTAYVAGNGITLHCPDPAVQTFIDAFWQHNHLDQRVPDWCDELCRSGEIFPVLFTNAQDGMSSVRCVPASLIEQIEWRPGDYEAELRYKELGLPGAAERWWVSPLHPDAASLPTPVMLHYAINRPVGALRGESDLAPVLPWLRRYARWLEDRVRLNAGVRAFLWVVKAPARLRNDLLERYRQPPEPGSVILADEQESWSAVAPNLNANDAANDGRAIRWMIVAGGPGASLLDLGEGEDSNLATGQVMVEMRRRFLRRRQAYLAALLIDLVTVAWERSGAGGRPLPAPEGGQSPGQSQAPTLAARPLITAVLPDISVEDNQKLAQASQQLASGLTSLAALIGRGPALRKLALRLFLKFAGEQISEREIEEMIGEGVNG